MNKKFKKWKEQKSFYYMISFFLPFAICIGILIGNGVYPFGDRCILHVDMYHQYCPFFTEFMEKLKNGGSLLYTWNLGMGSDFVSLYAYYLASPLNWLIILCPKGLVIEFMTLMILVKISACSLTFLIFLSGHYNLVGKDKKVHANMMVPALACSMAYAMCGFVAAYNWDIMWMDAIALTPLIILGLERLVKQQKPALYYITLAVSILANYYISFMICLFLVFYFVVLFVEQKQGRWIAAARFAIYSLLAGGTAAILIIPEMLILGYSGSSGFHFPETMEWYFGILPELARSGLAVSVYTGRDHWPNIYTGVFTILCFVFYVLNSRISWKQKLPRVLMLAFFLVSFSNNYLDFIWHGLHFPDSLPGRQSFLYSFLLLSMSYEAIRKWRGTKTWHIVTAVILCAALLIGGYLTSDKELVEPIAFLVTAIFLVCYVIFFILIRMSNANTRAFLRDVAFGVVIIELAVNFAVTSFSTTSRTLYTNKMKDYEVLLQQAKEESDGTFYRVEDLERKTKNDDMLYGYPSTTQFSSLMNINVSHFFQSVYMEGGKNFYCYNGATPLVSSMLSVKYILSDNPDEEGYLRTLIGQEKNAYLYENTYCLPLGFMVSEEMVDEWDNSSSFKVNNINQLAASLGATSTLLERASFESEETEGKTTFTMNEEGYYYAVYSSCNSDTLTETFEDGRSRNYSKTTHKYLLDLGYVKFGERVSICNTKQEELHFEVYKLNKNALDQAYATLNDQVMTLNKQTDTCIEGTIDVTREGRLLLSIANEEGWKLWVDGKEMPIESFKDTFISVHLEEGTHTIRLTYMTPGLKEGAIISGSCIGVFILMMVIRRIRRNRMNGKGKN